MRLLVRLFLLLMPLAAAAQSLLPECQTPRKHGCWASQGGGGGSYVGEWRNDNPHGKGTFIRSDGSRYVGTWDSGVPSGLGVEYAASGTVIRAGRWSYGAFESVQTVNPESYPFAGFRYGEVGLSAAQRVPPSTSVASGPSAVQSVPSSLPACPTSTGAAWGSESCTTTYAEGGGVYEGQFRAGFPDGNGRVRYPDGTAYVGEFKAGLRHGVGILYAASGEVVRSGRWEHGWLVQSGFVSVSQFPFSPVPAVQAAGGSTPLAPAGSAVSSSVDVITRLSAEVEAARKRQQELEERLAQEARDRERLVAEARERDRPQASRPATSRNERRVALVIGNSAYKTSPLENPVNDATDIARSLEQVGFQTTLIRNATLAQMRDATRRFADSLPSADVALIYFAGHGIESNRKNFMIPVNADLKFEYELVTQGYDASEWLEMLESIKSKNADRVNIVILDACRNNTLIGARSLGRGLGRMDAPTGTFLAFSTAPGKVAADGSRGQRNSPFTKHLLRAMQEPGLPIEEVFKDVRRNVSRETAGAQVPWESTSLTGFFSFRQMR